MTWFKYITDTSRNKHRGTIHKIYGWIHSEVKKYINTSQWQDLIYHESIISYKKIHNHLLNLSWSNNWKMLKICWKWIEIYLNIAFLLWWWSRNSGGIITSKQCYHKWIYGKLQAYDKNMDTMSNIHIVGFVSSSIVVK